jgi:hypothetical protein
MIIKGKSILFFRLSKPALFTSHMPLIFLIPM